ncbi:MAG TPA: UDP-N-acetylmuramoyl-L-alanyl-D-glutamate--2,6-diaminopimelate ligase [Bacillota bacterium]|nr:UDP-N-acetylmuramoyl-L-alanyl-D-glutamate--2,6-diaminopimelate ligase [Bacillota bacterium]
MNLAELVTALPIYQTESILKHVKVNSLQVDSREVKRGDLFICIKGFTVDGHNFAKQAEKNGAVAVVAERELQLSIPTIIVPDTTRALAKMATKFYNHPTEQLQLIGITGTNGKTTITYILEAIFQAYQQKTGVIGTIQMKIGNQSIPIVNTTPDAFQLQRSFNEMVKQKVEVVMMEVSSHALDLGRVAGCNFDIAIYTNLSQDHLDYHKNMDDYLRAKTLLFSQLGNSYAHEQPKFAIVNDDDPYRDAVIKSTTQNVITYGLTDNALIYATNINLQPTETMFELHTPKGSVAINSELIGKFNVYNMLAAASAAYVKDVPLNIIKQALEKISGVSGRFERVDVGQDYTVIVDYAHTPDSLENVLQTIKQFAQHKIYVVVGTGGDRDRTKRPLMANVAIEYAHYTFFTSDNPRTEKPEAIIDDMVSHLTDEHYTVIVDRQEAIYEAIKRAETDDIVLIAGKGHETGQEINGKIYPFDDREVAKKAIKRKGF